MKFLQFLLTFLLIQTGFAQNLQWVIPPLYERADKFHNGFASVGQGGKCGIITKEGRFLVKPTYEDIYFYDNAWMTILNYKNGLITPECHFKFEPIYDYTVSYNRGIARIRVGELYGFVDTTKKMISLPQFKYALPFIFLNTIVCEGNRWWVMDQNAKNIFNKYFDDIDILNPDSKYFIYTIAKKKGVIDIEGRIVTETIFDDIGHFNEGHAWAKIGAKYGLIDSTGKWILKPEYESVDDISEGIVLVQKSGKFGYLKLNGDWMLKPDYKSAKKMVGGYAIVNDNTIVNNEGKQIANTTMKIVTAFRENGTALIESNGLLGVIDVTGKTIIEPLYDDIALNADLFVITINEKRGLINKEGVMILKPECDFIWSCKEDLIAFVKNNKTGVVDKKGNILIPAILDATKAEYEFSEGLCAACFQGKCGYIKNPLKK